MVEEKVNTMDCSLLFPVTFVYYSAFFGFCHFARFALKSFSNKFILSKVNYFAVGFYPNADNVCLFTCMY